MQYPLIELLTAVVFVAVYDALMIGRVDSSLVGGVSDLIWLIAYWALFASLLANAVIDLELYIVDVRLTYFAMIVGVLASAASAAILPGVPSLPDVRMAGGALAMALGWVATALIAQRLIGTDQDDASGQEREA